MRKESPLKGRKVSAEAIAKRKATLAAKRAQGEIHLDDIPDDVGPKRKYTKRLKTKDPRMAAVVQMLKFAVTMLEEM